MTESIDFDFWSRFLPNLTARGALTQRAHNPHESYAAVARRASARHWRHGLFGLLETVPASPGSAAAAAAASSHAVAWRLRWVSASRQSLSPVAIVSDLQPYGCGSNSRCPPACLVGSKSEGELKVPVETR